MMMGTCHICQQRVNLTMTNALPPFVAVPHLVDGQRCAGSSKGSEEWFSSTPSLVSEQEGREEMTKRYQVGVGEFVHCAPTPGVTLMCEEPLFRIVGKVKWPESLRCLNHSWQIERGDGYEGFFIDAHMLQNFGFEDSEDGARAMLAKMGPGSPLVIVEKETSWGKRRVLSHGRSCYGS